MNTPIDRALFYMRLGYTNLQAAEGVLDAFPDADVDTVVSEARELFEQEERAAKNDAATEAQIEHGEFDA